MVSVAWKEMLAIKVLASCLVSTIPRISHTISVILLHSFSKASQKEVHPRQETQVRWKSLGAAGRFD